MIYKSYLVEQNLNIIKENIVYFMAENRGLQDDLKNRIKISNPNNEKINFLQEDIIHNSEDFYNEILNLSLFNEDKYFYIQRE